MGLSTEGETTVQSQPNNPDPNNQSDPYGNSGLSAHDPYQQSSPPQRVEPNAQASPQKQKHSRYPSSQHYDMPRYGAAPQPPASYPGSRRTLLIVLAVFVILLGVGTTIVTLVHSNVAQRDMMYATATAKSKTATAQVNITGIAGDYPFSENLKLNDPLKDNSGGYEWGDQDGCTFNKGTYRVSNDKADTYYACFAVKTSFNNFTYQVDAQLVKGGVLGILFRGNRADGQFYTFVVSSDGACSVGEYGGPEGTQTLKVADPGTLKEFDAFNTNQIGVVARNNTLAFYVNKQRVFTMNTSTFTEGQIGVVVYDTGGPVEASFSNAKVWVL